MRADGKRSVSDRSSGRAVPRPLADYIGPTRELPPPGSGPVEAVLFDLDDTLFDHIHSVTEGLKELRRSDEPLRRVPLAELVTRYGELLEQIQPGAPGGPRDHPEARVWRFQALDRWLGGPGDGALAEARSKRYRARYQTARRAVPNSAALLKHLYPRATIGIVTNNHQAEQEEKLRTIGLGPWIDFLLTSETAGVSKPDPAIFADALRRARSSPKSTVLVGDNWTTDVDGARAAGIHPVWRHLDRDPPRPLEGVWEIRSYARPAQLAERLLAVRGRR